MALNPPSYTTTFFPTKTLSSKLLTILYSVRSSGRSFVIIRDDGYYFLCNTFHLYIFRWFSQIHTEGVLRVVDCNIQSHISQRPLCPECYGSVSRKGYRLACRFFQHSYTFLWMWFPDKEIDIGFVQFFPRIVGHFVWMINVFFYRFVIFPCVMLKPFCLQRSHFTCG